MICCSELNGFDIGPGKGYCEGYSPNKLLSMSSQRSENAFAEFAAPRDVGKVARSEDSALSILILSANQYQNKIEGSRTLIQGQHCR
jgi:hypothetical protein